MLNSLFYNFNELIDQIQATFGSKVYSQTKLYSSENPGILIADDSSLVSLIKFDGNLKLIGNEEFAEILDRLYDLFSVPLG